MDIPTPFHVLLIEDSPEDRADIRQMLLRGSQRLYKFTEAETGAAGVRALLDHPDNPPDCVLLDFKLPDMDAFEVLAAMRGDGEQTVCPVVVVTGTMESGAQVIRAGAQDYVGKSWATPESLTRSVENAVERYALGRERLVNHAALRESRHFLQRITEVALGVLHVYDLEKQSFVFVSRAVVSAIGYPEEEITAMRREDLAALMHPEDLPRLAGHLQRVRTLGDGEHADFEFRVRAKSGEWRWFQNRDAVFARDAEGAVQQTIGAALDITERKRAEELQRASSSYARSLIEASLDPLVTISAQGKITDVNEASVQATGVPREQLIGTDFSDYFTAPDNARAGYRQVFSEGYVKDYPLAIRHTTGRVMDVLYNAAVYRDDQGKVLGAFAAARDVTVQKQASQYARSLIEASLDPLVTISAQGKITDVNEASVQATGVPREQLIGRDFSDYFTEPDNARAGYQKAFSEGLVRDYPLAIRHTTGRIMDVLYNAVVYRDDKGKVLGVFAAARDVTERKRFEQSLEQSNEELRTKSNENVEIERKNAELEQARHALEEKAAELARASGYKSEFLANMAHELRTPLNVILLLSQQLAENKPGNLSAKQREYAHLVHSSGTDLLNLINDILDLAKIESGTVTVKVEELSLARLCDSLTRHFQPVADAKKLTLHATLAQGLPPSLHSDTQRVRQILKNLVANALKFTSRGRVEVRVGLATQGWPPDHPVLSQAPHVIAFTVEDTGIGIAPEQRERIFESFQQADATTSRHHGGTGLGLAISRELAALLGGAITLTSAPGRGSTFTLYLPQKFVGPDRTGDARDAGDAGDTGDRKIIVEIVPRSEPLENSPDYARQGSVAPFPEEAPAGRVRPDVSRRILRGRKVLVVDDDVRNIYALTALLENHGLETLSATAGRSAICLLENTPDVGLVLMDIMMPEMDGYEIMRLLRQSPQFRTLPILALTAHAMPGDREKCLEAGANDYLAKPVNPEQLLAVMSDWMAR